MSIDLFQNQPITHLKTQSYGEFRTQLRESNCKACPLHQKRTHIVIDRGNPNSRVMIIGEAPGANEDLQAKPFVGRAGKLLDALLAEFQFDTNRDSLVANIAKCRPPNNRPPTKDEAKTCLPYLQTQIKLMQPEYLLLLGATALKHLLPHMSKLRLNDIVGQFIEHKDFSPAKIMILFHPAYILRDPRKKPLMRKHLSHFHQEWLK